MKKFISIFMVVAISGCIEPVSLDIEGGGQLVVDGWITDQPGPYTIKLSRSIRFNNSNPLKVYSIPELKAKVSIKDGAGNVEALIEDKDGRYRTVALKGKVGDSYQLIIETADGKKYKSNDEVMEPVPKIDAIEYEFQVNESIFTNSNGDARVQKLEGFNVYVRATDPAERSNYYRWQADGIFEFFSVGDLPIERLICWVPVTRLESKIEQESDQYFNGQQFRHYVATVPYDRPTRYQVKLRQQSLSAAAHEFWRKLSSQQTSTGTLFDPPPTSITGNVRNENNFDDAALGYFGATAIAQSSIVFDRFVASNRTYPSRYKAPRQGFCLNHEPNATDIRPEGF